MTSDDFNLQVELGLAIIQMSASFWERTFTPEERQEFKDLNWKRLNGEALSEWETRILKGFDERHARGLQAEGWSNRRGEFSNAMDRYWQAKDWREEQKRSSPIGRLEPDWDSPAFGLQPVIFFIAEEIDALENAITSGRCLSDSNIGRLAHLRSIRQPVLDEFNRATADYERLLGEERERREQRKLLLERAEPQKIDWFDVLWRLTMIAGVIGLGMSLRNASVQETLTVMCVMQAAALVYWFKK